RAARPGRERTRTSLRSLAVRNHRRGRFQRGDTKMSHLVPCPSCQRHVRTHEVSCPFCGAPLDLSGVAPRRLPPARLGRAATLAFGTLLGASALVTGCGGSTEDSGDEEAQAGDSSDSGGMDGGLGGDTSTGGWAVGPVYGAPAAGGAQVSGGTTGSGGTPGTGGTPS